jgi:hypothetical protein
MKYYLTFFLTTAIVLSCNAGPNDSIPTIPADTVLYISLADYHQSLVGAQLAEFEIQSKGNWMNYIPSVGVGYTPNGEPRPTMSFSLSQIFTAQKNREAIEAKRRGIIATATLLHQSEIRQLSTLLRQYQLQTKELNFAYTIYEIDTRLFEFYATQHDNHELTASQFLMKEKDYLLNKQLIIRLKNKLEEKKLEIFEKCNFKF